MYLTLILNKNSYLLSFTLLSRIGTLLCFFFDLFIIKRTTDLSAKLPPAEPLPNYLTARTVKMSRIRKNKTADDSTNENNFP